MDQHLPRVSLGTRIHPDPRKQLLLVKLHYQFRIPPVGLLLPLATGANLRRISDPHLMPQLRKQLLEPLRLPTRFDPHSHGPLQPSVKGPHLLLSLVTQRPLQHLSRRLVPHDNLLIARMKITAYNLHRSAPSSRALVAHHAKSTRVQGADLVMKSNGASRLFLSASRLRTCRLAQSES